MAETGWDGVEMSASWPLVSTKPGNARAQIKWRVTTKFDVRGNRADYGT